MMEMQNTNKLLIDPANGPPTMEMVEGKVRMGNGMLIQQKNSECCKFWLCQPNIHWNVSPYREEVDSSNDYPAVATIIEDAPYCGRVWSCCAPGCRETKYTVLEGNVDVANLPKQNGRLDLSDVGVPLMTHEKKRTCGTFCLVITPWGAIPVPMCTNLPYLETSSNGQVVGRTEYLCDKCLFVPKFAVKDANGQEVYRIRPDTCCAGCCVRCRCGGKGGKCFSVPYIIRDPTTQEKMDEAHITDLWAGLKKECCTRKNNWQVKFPENATDEMKMTLMGAALLVELTMVEQGDQ